MEKLALVLSVVAIIASGLVAWYTQHSMNRRERTKWEREELTKIVSELVSLSSQRDQTIRVLHLDAVGWPQSTASLLDPADALQRMTPLVAQLELLTPGPLSRVAKLLAKEHTDSYTAAEDETAPDDALSKMLMSPGALEILHQNLAKQFRAAIGDAKYVPELTEHRLTEVRNKEQKEFEVRVKETEARNARLLAARPAPPFQVDPFNQARSVDTKMPPPLPGDGTL
ncbi:hypothetical protein [Rhodococcus sp. 008]|uniref:hypothetical protein n=1 Tax=Rhodococcus sp. 008 TaxID=1723645 RepID=UPI0012EA859A|nr:hypothetical protein [Rhodococcus sp. 008]